MELIKKNKAIFLDRDGVINKERGDYTYRLQDFEINAELIEALQILRDKNYLFIVVTNQAGIAKGLYNKKQVEILHNYFLKICNENQIQIAEIYYCPHFTAQSECICRKPNSLLLEKAMARFGIDAKKSYFIGDRDRDMAAAKKVGVGQILIESNASLLNYLYLIS